MTGAEWCSSCGASLNDRRRLRPARRRPTSLNAFEARSFREDVAIVAKHNGPFPFLEAASPGRTKPDQSETKPIQETGLGFPWIRSSNSGPFNGLQRLQTEFSFATFRRSVISVFKKSHGAALSCRDDLPNAFGGQPPSRVRSRHRPSLPATGRQSAHAASSCHRRRAAACPAPERPCFPYQPCFHSRLEGIYRKSNVR